MKLLFVLVLALPSLANAAGLSAYRSHSESYQDALVRSTVEKQLKTGEVFHQPLFNRRASAEAQKRPIDQIQYSKIPNIETEKLNELFSYLRDTKFMKSRSQERRATWLYPDDGCYARAGVMALNTMSVTPVQPAKIFVFGELNVKTPNTLSGWAAWWYHVAIAYSADGESYVIDPAIEPNRPLKVREWLLAMNQDLSKVRVSICHKDAYDPESNCERPRAFSQTDIYREQNMFLPLEWNRLMDLNRDPEQELGENPPWRQ